MVQEVPAFRDFTIRDPRHFVIQFRHQFRENPLHFVNLKKKIQKKFPKKKNSEKKNFFWIFFFKIMKFGLKQNHEMAGITNCEITKCGDLLYTFEHFMI